MNFSKQAHSKKEQTHPASVREFIVRVLLKVNSQMALVYLAFLLQLIASSLCETIDILTLTDEQCSGEFPCRTLQQYVSCPSSSSHVVFQMQTGNHTLSSELRATNIDNFTMTSTNAQVMCTSSAAQVLSLIHI